MKCPKCWNAEMGREVFQGVELDLCPGCRGIRFDCCELEAVLQMSPAPEVERLPKIRLGSGAQNRKAAYCFACDAEMEARAHEGLRIDWCPKCRCVFLDSGELTALQDPR